LVYVFNDFSVIVRPAVEPDAELWIERIVVSPFHFMNEVTVGRIPGYVLEKEYQGRMV
jgi:hypothetical protein